MSGDLMQRVKEFVCRIRGHMPYRQIHWKYFRKMPIRHPLWDESFRCERCDQLLDEWRGVKRR